MQDPSLTERALACASEAHRGQIREVSGVPYVFHTVEVAKRLGDFGVLDEEVIAAALLHDAVEDTEVSRKEIERLFGSRVARFVDEMTFDERKQKKGEYLAAFAVKSPEALAIKLADRGANVADYARERADYAPIYAGKANALYAAVVAREAELTSTFGEEVAARLVAEAERLRAFAAP
ncbi:Guanosine-3',5'-bis(diphosphate) 3'-pyrophosphohydrolase [Planctomycetes bacterium Poly30]|uniref:Guanosine-3',5'-bis(Diphosphate) 3'-pyrophosphohydrolase n=1 Tax=Saltatorellus ferox TaxID=2528018 RepID=A0A518ELU5_9BACT|nr:Guanosine-3',5'-bis(diphosphate) 3'-pyrophosphohydrolase [Planctomycetes bacterium Poly30]